MSKTREVSLLAGAAVTLGAFGSAIAAEDQAYGSSDEVRAVVADMLADAETRSSLLQSGGGIGYDEDNGFYIEGPNGNSRLNIRALSQTRYVLNFNDDEDADPLDPDAVIDESDFESGFQQARTKIDFHGHVIDPNIFYYIRTDFSRDGGGNTLQWAWGGYRFNEGWHVKFGQFRPQFLREHNVLPEYQLGIDRSPTNYFFDQGDAQGIELGYESENWRGFFAFTDGFNSANTDFTTRKVFMPAFDPVTGDLTFFPNYTAAGGESDLALTGRAEIRFQGMWDQFDDFTSMPGSEMGVMVGVAGHVEHTNEDRVTGGGDATYYSWTVDVSVEGDGWNLFAAGIGGHTSVDDVTVDALGTTSDQDFDDFGVVLQGGWFIPETDWELFGRYDVIFLDDEDDRVDEDTFQTIAVGANWYWAGQAAKFSVDLQWFLDEPSGLTSGTNTLVGYVGGSSEDEDQFAVRAQFQLLF